MPPAQRTHYDVLGVSRTSDLTSADIKQAYHETLLTYHPDKIQQASPSRLSPTSVPFQATSRVPTIDDIVSAYAVLSDSTKKAAYDVDLKSQWIIPNRGPNPPSHAGLETYDLDEMEYNEKSGCGTWSRRCRCGNEQGYLVTEEELEDANQGCKEPATQDDSTREILVACRGCSLLIRVTFAVDVG